MGVRYPVEASLREFLYHALYTYPEEKKFNLKGVFYKIGQSQYHARKFCDTASHEQIFHLAALMGIRWFIILYDDVKKDQRVRNLLDNYREDTRNTDLDVIVKRKIYVTSDKKFIHGLGIMADNISSAAYKQTLELAKAGYHTRKWKKEIGLPNTEGFKEQSETIDYLAETMINSFLAIQRSNLSQYDTLLLLYFYRNRHRYVTYQSLFVKFEWAFGQLKVKRAIGHLQKLELINKHVKPKRKDYQITSLGILEVSRLLDAVVKANIF